VCSNSYYFVIWVVSLVRLSISLCSTYNEQIPETKYLPTINLSHINPTQIKRSHSFSLTSQSLKYRTQSKAALNKYIPWSTLMLFIWQASETSCWPKHEPNPLLDIGDRDGATGRVHCDRDSHGRGSHSRGAAGITVDRHLFLLMTTERGRNVYV